MNRTERRRINAKPEPTYLMKKSQIDAMVERRVWEMMPKVTEEALLTMIYNSVMVIEGHFGELMKRDGRVQKYVELLQFQTACFADRMVTAEDMRKYLKDTYDIEVELI